MGILRDIGVPGLIIIVLEFFWSWIKMIAWTWLVNRYNAIWIKKVVKGTEN